MSIACLLVVLICGVASADTVRHVALVHRHGARTAFDRGNATVQCPQGCGQLTREGKAMLTALGDAVRTRYGTVWPEAYSTATVRSRSTAVGRTLQSAAAVLRAVFPAAPAFFPVIHSAAPEEDTLLRPAASMAFEIPRQARMEPGYRVPPAVFERFNAAVLQAMADETALQALCGRPRFSQEEYLQCCWALYDVGSAWRAAGVDAVVLGTSLESLGDIVGAMMAAEYVFQPSDPAQAQRGAIGYPLARAVVAEMEHRALGGAAPALAHYSAHQSTIVPLLSAIADTRAVSLPPGFGQALLLELREGAVLGAWSVSALWGAPQQTPHDRYNYTFQGLSLGCKSAAGAVRYTAAGDCSLEDFSRFVNSTAPESAKGDCYVEEKVLEDIGCDTVHPASTAACRLYRRQCPFRSCPAKHVLNDADLSCVTTEDKQRITNVGAAIMIVSSLAAGLLVGAAVVLVASLLRRRHLEEDGDSYKQVS